MNTEYLKKDLLDLSYVIVTILIILFIILCCYLAIIINWSCTDRLNRPEPQNQEAVEMQTIDGNPDNI